MGGLMSRRKGLRVEYLVRDYLRELKIYDDVFRVPLSGASEGYKSDVVGRRQGLEDTFEVKARASGFDTIYDLYNANKDDNGFVGLADTADGATVLVAISTKFLDVWKAHENWFKKADFKGPQKKTFNKTLRLRELLQGAKYLVIKANNKPLLFLRFWD